MKSAVECLAILVNPMNSEIYMFPLQRTENDKQDPYVEYKTTFEHIEKIRSNFCALYIESGMNDIFPILFELDMEGSLKGAILRVIIYINLIFHFRLFFNF